MVVKIGENIFYYEYKVKNSKFCCYSLKISNISEIKNLIKKYYDSKASHNCYAYVVEENDKIVFKGFDDNEPHNCAGNAMLYVLIKQKIFNILIINIRYFRNPKLGASKLKKSYQHGVIELLKNVRG